MRVVLGLSSSGRKQDTSPELLVLVAVVVVGVGEAAGEHPRTGADAWGCSSRPEAGQVGLAARTGIRGGHGTGGHALRRRRKAGEGRARLRGGRRSRWRTRMDTREPGGSGDATAASCGARWFCGRRENESWRGSE